VGARFDLADCEEKLGQLPGAWLDFRLAAQLAADRGDSRRGELLDRAVALERRLFVITFPQVAGLAVHVDGAPIDGALVRGGSVALQPGAHDIEGAASGYEPKKEHTSGGPGQVFRLELTPTPTPAPVSSTSASVIPARDEPGPGAAQRTIGLVVAGVGAAGLAAGLVFGVLTLVKRGDAAGQCQGAYPMCTNTDPASQAAITKANGDATTFSTVADLALAVGAVAAAAGIVIYFLAPSSGSKSGGAGLRLGVSGLSVTGGF
jgi:hypothetical protein